MVAATDLPTIQDLMRKRKQLVDRLARIPSVGSLAAMAELLSGTGMEDDVLTLSKQQVTQYLDSCKSEIETQLAGMGVDLNA